MDPLTSPYPPRCRWFLRSLDSKMAKIGSKSDPLPDPPEGQNRPSSHGQSSPLELSLFLASGWPYGQRGEKGVQKVTPFLTPKIHFCQRGPKRLFKAPGSQSRWIKGWLTSQKVTFFGFGNHPPRGVHFTPEFVGVRTTRWTIILGFFQTRKWPIPPRNQV